MGNLSNQYISQSFQSLLHLGSDNTASATLTEIQDALGNGVGVFVNTAGNLKVTNNISASAISASTLYGFGNPVNYSASVSEQLKALENITSSLINVTGSYATTGSNSFIGNQSISGDLDISGQLRVTSIYTTQETSSIIFSSGSNILGDNTNDTQTLNGLVRVSGSSQFTGSVGINDHLAVKFSISSSTIVGMGNVTNFSSSIASQFYTQTDVYNQNNDTKWTTLQPVTSSLIDKVYSIEQFTASQQTYNTDNDTKWNTLQNVTSSQNTKNLTLQTYTASVDTKFTAVGISTSSLNAYTASNDTKWTTLATTTASFSSSLQSLNSKTGSYATTGSNTFVGKQTMNAGLFVPVSATSSSINSISASIAINPLDVVINALSGAIQLAGSNNNNVRVLGGINFANRSGVVGGEIEYLTSGFVGAPALLIGMKDSGGEIRVYSGSAAYGRVSINDYFNVAPAGYLTRSGSVSITGSLTINNLLQLAQSNPLPAGSDGSMAVSGSNLYFYSGSDWRKVTLG